MTTTLNTNKQQKKKKKKDSGQQQLFAASRIHTSFAPCVQTGGGGAVAKKAPYPCGNFHAWAFTRFQEPQQLGRARIACSCHVRQRAGPALLQAAAETTGIWGRKKAVRRVRQSKEVGLREWPLAGRATVPRVLYSTSWPARRCPGIRAPR